MDEITYIIQLFINAYLIGFILLVAILLTLPKALRLLGMTGRVYENTLTLVSAALIVYFAVYYIMRPLSVSPGDWPQFLVVIGAVSFVVYKVAKKRKGRA